jgi:hypothetical protein
VERTRSALISEKCLKPKSLSLDLSFPCFGGRVVFEDLQHLDIPLFFWRSLYFNLCCDGHAQVCSCSRPMSCLAVLKELYIQTLGLSFVEVGAVPK